MPYAPFASSDTACANPKSGVKCEVYDTNGKAVFANAGAIFNLVHSPNSEATDYIQFDTKVCGSCGWTLPENPQTSVISFLNEKNVINKANGQRLAAGLAGLDLVTCGLSLVGDPFDGFVTGAVTIYSCGRAIGSDIDAETAKKDPPDPNFRKIALAVSSAGPPQLAARRSCGRRLGHTLCLRLLAAEGRYLSYLNEATADANAAAIAINRNAGARDASDGAQMLAQQAAIDVYIHDAAIAYADMARAGRIVGGLWRRAGLDVVLSAAQVARVRAALLQGPGLPKGVLTFLSRSGITTSPTELAGLLGEAFKDAGPPQALRLSDGLPTVPPMTGFASQWDRITPANLQALATTLASQHAISSRAARRLSRDVTEITIACTRKSRASAARQFIADAAHVTRGQGARLLKQTAQPLTLDHKGASPPIHACTHNR